MPARRYSPEQVVLFLRDIVRQKPFLAPKSKVKHAWNALADTINAGADAAGAARVQVTGSSMRGLFECILGLRRREVKFGLTHNFVGATYEERKRLLDECISLLDARQEDALEQEQEPEQEAAVAQPVTARKPMTTAKRVKVSKKVSAPATSPRPTWRPFNACEFVFMLRELLQQPPQPSDLRLACENIAAKMRADPALERPTVVARSIHAALVRLINRRRQQLESNSIACLADDDVCIERDLLLDRWIHLEDAVEKAQRSLLPAPTNGAMSSGDDEDKESVQMLRLRLEAERRVREHAYRIEEEMYAKELREAESRLRQKELEILRLEREAEREVRVQVAKAVAEGVSTGIAAILAMVNPTSSFDAQNT